MMSLMLQHLTFLNKPILSTFKMRALRFRLESRMWKVTDMMPLRAHHMTFPSPFKRKVPDMRPLRAHCMTFPSPLQGKGDIMALRAHHMTSHDISLPLQMGDYGHDGFKRDTT